jgi:hypothetical protein
MFEISLTGTKKSVSIVPPVSRFYIYEGFRARVCGVAWHFACSPGQRHAFQIISGAR